MYHGAYLTARLRQNCLVLCGMWPTGDIEEKERETGCLGILVGWWIGNQRLPPKNVPGSA